MKVAENSPGLLSLGRLVDLDGEASTLGPARVHPQQHLGPVLGVGAAGAGVQLDDRVVLVVRSAEETLGLERGDGVTESVNRDLELVEERAVDLIAYKRLAGEFGQDGGVVQRAA